MNCPHCNEQVHIICEECGVRFKKDENNELRHWCNGKTMTEISKNQMHPRGNMFLDGITLGK